MMLTITPLEYAELRASRQETRALALEEACRAVCPWCRNVGQELSGKVIQPAKFIRIGPRGGVFWHPEDIAHGKPCQAGDIRKIIMNESENPIPASGVKKESPK